MKTSSGMLSGAAGSEKTLVAGAAAGIIRLKDAGKWAGRIPFS